jgi:hypothetical protein
VLSQHIAVAAKTISPISAIIRQSIRSHVDSAGKRGSVADDSILRNVIKSDLTILFDHQRDPDASRMAAFISRDPSDWDAFLKH